MSKFLNNVLFSTLLAACLAVVMASAFQYEVGEKMGWKKPNGTEPETYNEWAAKNRFHIGDSVNFKYQNDSVLEVTSADYLKCNTANPISKYEDGNSTVFQFHRPGFFYFISGEPDHCNSGQRLIVRVMHPSEQVEAPVLAPSGGPSGGWEWGAPPTVNSTTKLEVVSYFLTTLAGLFIILYMFM
ncbi:hypothetical protein ACJIZ3_013012 [Penstemon smallii]|uniref:Phytocyanin domain-containing protein n=1 Tax=Penstemon smallii TaxID=265156 RepID=A0ABD3UPZ9_9LAMI